MKPRFETDSFILMESTRSRGLWRVFCKDRCYCIFSVNSRVLAFVWIIVFGDSAKLKSPDTA